MSGKKVRLVLALAALLCIPFLSMADPAGISGSGNFTTGDKEATAQSQFATLRAAGAEAIRMDVYPYNYWDGEKALPEKMEKQILEAHEAGVKKMILLFEYQGSYQKVHDAPNQLGDYDKWHSIGEAYAQRFSPNSPWLKARGILDWGINIFAAFNEPDGENPKDFIPKTGPSSYYSSLKGLADGVHSVNPALAVIPGGFMAENAWLDHTLRGYGLALAPLWNDGTLDGIDLHTYNDIKYAPIIREDGSVVFTSSAQAGFDAVKKECHITRDINFYTTEYNFKANTQGIEEPLAAKRFLTCIWNSLGVVKNDGKTPATKLALVWNLFLTDKEDQFDGGTYGLVLKQDPLTPTDRGKTYRLVLSLTKGMEFTSLDPKGHGEYVMEGAGKKLWVWQNYVNWTDMPGTSFTVNDIPAKATKLDVYGWDGLRKSIPLSGKASYTVGDLRPNETYMFLVTADGDR